MSFVVKKSNKKFAPKAQARPRPRPASTQPAAEGTSAPLPSGSGDVAESQPPTQSPETSKAALSQPVPDESTVGATRQPLSSGAGSNQDGGAGERANEASRSPTQPRRRSMSTSSNEVRQVFEATTAATPPPPRPPQPKATSLAVPVQVPRPAQAPTPISVPIPTPVTTPSATPLPISIPTPAPAPAPSAGSASAPISVTAPATSSPSVRAVILTPIATPIGPPQPGPSATKRRRVEQDRGIAIQMPTIERDAIRQGAPVSQAVSQRQTSASDSQAQSASRAKKGKQRATASDAQNDATADGAEGATRKKRRKKARSITPEGGDALEIEPGVVRMTDLCRDTHIGKKSKRYEEIEKLDWAEIVRKQRQRKAELAAEKAAGAVHQAETVSQRLDRLARENMANNRQSNAMVSAQMRILNGDLVPDEQSLQIDRRERDAGDQGPMEIVEESNLTRRVNSGTWGRRERTERWDELETDRFFTALSMFGTDFELISKMFPGRSRRQMKNKFNNEERKNPGRINDALKNKTAVNLVEYATIVGQDFRPVEDVEAELQKIRDDHKAEQEAAKRQLSELAKERNAAATAAYEEENAASNDPQSQMSRKNKKLTGKKGYSRHNGPEEEIIGTID